MTVQAAIEQEIAFLRAENTAAMPSRVNVHRLTGNTTEDPKGFEVPEWDLIHSAIPFRLGGSRSGDGGQRTVTVGGVEFSQATAVGNFPWDTFDLRDGDFIEVVEGEWVESVFSIVEAVKGDQRTARRVPVVEVPRPEEWPS